MAYTIVWPGALPQVPESSYSEKSGVLLLRTPMDAGPAKMRRRGAKPSVLTLSYFMTVAQLENFEAFVHETLRGTKRFGFPHPRTKEMVEVRLLPGSDGDLYTLSNATRGLWSVRFEVEVLP